MAKSRDKLSLGVDFGTNSVRALLVNCATGQEVSSCVVNYPSGEQGVLLDPRDHNLARQNPADYILTLKASVRGVVEKAKISATDVIGIGVDSTGSSPMPVDNENRPLALHEKWRDHQAAQCWLWKDHTAFREAAEITSIGREIRPQYLAKCGGTYSSEWWWSKIWHCLRIAPEIFAAAHSWVELCDFIPALLSGVRDPKQIRRGICAAGHKAMFSSEWGGLPDREFLSQLAPQLADLRDRLYDTAYDAHATAGSLCEEWANELGLSKNIPIAIGAFDVHYGAIGSGIQEGVLVKAIGTSTCDCAIVDAQKNVGDIPGICGIVRGSILPNAMAIEAGQSAVGDIFKWFVEGLCQGDAALHQKLMNVAEKQLPGQSGVLALDWNNGNRTVLVDPLLSGLLIGQTLHTTQADIYRALIEATAFGARTIIARITDYGVPVRQIVCCGGIADKNHLFMQIYADVLGCEVGVAASNQACALGSAIVAAVVAGRSHGGYDDFAEAQKHMVAPIKRVYSPQPHNVAVYNELYVLYQRLHNSFGGVEKSVNLGTFMKDLMRIKATSQKQSSQSLHHSAVQLP